MSLGFYVDMTRCFGCRTCQVACKDRFDLQMAGPRTRHSETFECGSYPEAAVFHLTMSCNHCEQPACVAACPTGAMYKDADDTVQHDDTLCIGCQACVAACPYGAPQYVEDWNLVVKCDTCRPLREAGGNPVCVDACPMRAIDFGDISELQERHGATGLVSELPCLPAFDETQPNLLIKPCEAALREDFVPVTL